MFEAKKFGAYLSEKRKSLRMTQSELAEELCLTRQAVSKYETGDSFPDISILIKIAEILDTSLDELIYSGKPAKGEMDILLNSIDAINSNAVSIDDFNDELLKKLMPFLNNTAKEIVLRRMIDGEIDWRLIQPILPHIEDMTRLLEAAVIDGALPTDVSKMINDYFIEKANARRQEHGNI